jgi:hypothetical protein
VDPAEPEPFDAVGTAPATPFWRRKRLEELNGEEWEALCDGCGKCCLEKLEDADTGAISFTEVACTLLDIGSCRCRHYEQRRRFVPNCERLTPAVVRAVNWLPSSCAYRLVADGNDLPWWHYLVSGDRDLVHRIGASASGRAVRSGPRVRLEHHIVDWPA